MQNSDIENAKKVAKPIKVCKIMQQYAKQTQKICYWLEYASVFQSMNCLQYNVKSCKNTQKYAKVRKSN